MKKFVVILHDAKEVTDSARSALKSSLLYKLPLSSDALDALFAELPAIIGERSSKVEAEELKALLEEAGGFAEVLESDQPSSANELAFDLDAPLFATSQTQRLPVASEKAGDKESFLDLDLSLKDLTDELDAALGIEASVATAEAPESTAHLDNTPGPAMELSLGGAEVMTVDAGAGAIEIESPSVSPLESAEPPIAPPLEPPPAPPVSETRPEPNVENPPELLIESYSPSPRRNLDLRLLTVCVGAVLMCILLTIGLKFTIFGFGDDTSVAPVSSDTLATLVQQLRTKQRESLKKAAEAAAPQATSERPAWIGTDSDQWVDAEVTPGAIAPDRMVVDLVFTTPPPQKLTPKEIVSGAKLPVWIERVEARDVELRPSAEQSKTPGAPPLFEGMAIGRGYVNDNGNRTRLSLRIAITGTFPKDGQPSIDFLISTEGNTTDLPAGEQIGRGANGVFVVSLRGAMILQSRSGTAQPSVGPPTAAKSENTPPSTDPPSP